MNPLRHLDHGIPVLKVSGQSIALAWELSLFELFWNGCHIETEYDAAGDPPSIDSTMVIEVRNPMSEPAIHRCFPGGLEDLEEYRMEFVEGIKDHWVKDPNDPDYSGEWTYTYNRRFRKYECYARSQRKIGAGDATEVYREFKTIDQVAAMIDALAKAPHSRRQQCVTWQPWIDMHTSDPPCLQSFWMRISQDANGNYVLNANARFRSRDAYGAAFMNLWGEVAFMEKVAGELQVKLGRPVKVGRLCDISDSFHIYGRNLAEFKERFLDQNAKRTLKERTFTREFAQPIFDEARPMILEKIRKHNAEHGLKG